MHRFANKIFTQHRPQCGAAVAKLRNEIAKLMSGIGHRDRLGARGHDVAGKHRRYPVPFETSCIDPQFCGERFVEPDKTGPCDRRRRKSRKKMLRQARIAVGEDSDRAGRAFGGGWFLHCVSQRHASQISVVDVRYR